MKKFKIIIFLLIVFIVIIISFDCYLVLKNYNSKNQNNSSATYEIERKVCRNRIAMVEQVIESNIIYILKNDNMIDVEFEKNYISYTEDAYNKVLEEINTLNDYDCEVKGKNEKITCKRNLNMKNSPDFLDAYIKLGYVCQ